MHDSSHLTAKAKTTAIRGRSPLILIADAVPGAVATVRGVVRSVRIAPWASDAECEFVVADISGRMVVRSMLVNPEVTAGTTAEVCGIVSSAAGRRLMVNAIVQPLSQDITALTTGPTR